MSLSALRRLEICHEALISALDGGDLEALNDKIAALHESIQAIRGEGAWRELPEAEDRALHIIALAQAALMRVNFLTDVTRQRLEAVQALRGRAVPGAYGPNGRRLL